MSLIIYPRRECITTPNYSCEIGENLYNSRSRGNIIIPPFFTRENKREIKFRKSIDLEMKVTTSLFVQRGIRIERLEKIGEKKNLDIPFDWRFRILPPRSEFILRKRSSKLDNSASCVASRFIVTEAERIRIRSGFTGSRNAAGGLADPWRWCLPSRLLLAKPRRSSREQRQQQRGKPLRERGWEGFLPLSPVDKGLELCKRAQRYLGLV